MHDSLVIRLNVAGILVDDQGHVLICERTGLPGAWQFPQGGVDTGESLESALIREIWEEIGLNPEHFRIIDGKGPYRYLFPGAKLVRGHHGKDQHFFLMELLGPKDAVNVNTEHAEFQQARWIAPAEFQMNWVPEMKKDMYQQVFRDLLGIELQA
jgi:putative (di)nucleoside polyphosphate hydrolase